MSQNPAHGVDGRPVLGGERGRDPVERAEPQTRGVQQHHRPVTHGRQECQAPPTPWSRRPGARRHPPRVPGARHQQHEARAEEHRDPGEPVQGVKVEEDQLGHRRHDEHAAEHAREAHGLAPRPAHEQHQGQRDPGDRHQHVADEEPGPGRGDRRGPGSRRSPPRRRARAPRAPRSPPPNGCASEEAEPSEGREQRPGRGDEQDADDRHREHLGPSDRSGLHDDVDRQVPHERQQAPTSRTPRRREHPDAVGCRAPSTASTIATARNTPPSRRR